MYKHIVYYSSYRNIAMALFVSIEKDSKVSITLARISIGRLSYFLKDDI